jgi:hypothetical protein
MIPDTPSISTNIQAIIEASPDHFVMIGSGNGGEYVKLQLSWVHAVNQVTNLPETTILYQPIWSTPREMCP